LSRSPQSLISPIAHSSVRHRSLSPANGNPFSGRTPEFPFAALNIEFVAKPETASNVQNALPGAIHSAFSSVTGFAGGLVFIANYEARLVTVVTLWTGQDRARLCETNLRWIRALIAPYLDRCLRVQTFSAVPSNPGQLDAEFSAQAPPESLEQSDLREDAIYAA
jgi:hypothetical protein